MATKKRKKKPPGGLTGKPPLNEPRVQLFSKFAGCNFQLATRDPNDLFNTEQDAQTDLMPMLMAIQNNARIAPFGGIETRQNLVKLFDAPLNKKLTGIATLIGDRLYTACDDMTVNHGLLGENLENSIQMVDLNSTYEPPVKWTHPGCVSDSEEWTLGPEVMTSDHSGSCSGIITGGGTWTEQNPAKLFDFTTTGNSFRIELMALNDTYPLHADHFHVGIKDPNSGMLVTGTVQVSAVDWPWPPTAWYSTEKFTLAAGTYECYAWTDDYIDFAVAGVDGVRRRVYEQTHQHRKTFTCSHQVQLDPSGVVTKVRYRFEHDVMVNPPDLSAVLSHVHIHHGDINGPLIYDADLLTNTDVTLNHPVAHDEYITIVVITDYRIGLFAYEVDVSEAIDDNTWTFLGYADDQLVGMTANQQIWNGALADHKLANALTIANPNALTVASNLTGAGVNVATAYNVSTHPYRVTISHTYLNEFGPTLPSTTLTFYASKPANEWTTAAYVNVHGLAPNITAGISAGITAVELYYTEGEAREPAFLGRVNVPDITANEQGHDHPPTTKSWSFNWIGYDKADTSLWTIANLTAPTENYTTGVPASKMAVLDGQLYFWGNETYPYRIWIGGNPGNRFSVSPGTGGGFVDVEPGTGTVVKNVLKFKTQQGAAIVTSLCDNPNSRREARFNLVENVISISDEQSIKGWMAEKIAGAVGCKSSYGAVAAGDGLYSVSRYGLAVTTLTMEYNSQLQVQYISDPIEPVFNKQYGHQLDVSQLLEADGILYMTFGAEDGTLDNVIFCYDINLKAWWTYTLDVDEPILSMLHIDSENRREGIGIITEDSVYLLPTTMDEAFTALPDDSIILETGELTTMQPIQSTHHLSQLEFRFDYFIGTIDIVVTMIDQFGRTITVNKHVSHGTLQHSFPVHMRIDKVIESYKVVITGQAKMRMTHLLSKSYPKSNRVGMVHGFDSRQSHTSPGSIQRTFSDYNDLKDAILPRLAIRQSDIVVATEANHVHQ